MESRERRQMPQDQSMYDHGEIMKRSLSGDELSGESPAPAPEWEVRPGGMLVQKRITDPFTAAVQDVRLRISYGTTRHDVSVSPQATFGELKKVLEKETGLQPGEQKILYRGKVRANGEFLDVCGVKDRSKLVLLVDPMSMERRYIEMRKNAKFQSAHRAISNVSIEVDKLADQVTAFEKSIQNGVKVTEVQITALIELLMKQAVKLDSIPTDGDTTSQKNIQVMRVRKCVETLDLLKISNSKVKPVIVTTKWETFDAPNMAHWEIFE